MSVSWMLIIHQSVTTAAEKFHRGIQREGCGSCYIILVKTCFNRNSNYVLVIFIYQFFFINFRFELHLGIFWFFLKQIVLKSDLKKTNKKWPPYENIWIHLWVPPKRCIFDGGLVSYYISMNQFLQGWWSKDVLHCTVVCWMFIFH
jgi:hypothetical protein